MADASIQIDKGVPVPKPNAGRPSIYPFARMEAGDSFAINGGARERNALSSCANAYARRHGRKFVTRQLTENGHKVVRCWRVA